MPDDDSRSLSEPAAGHHGRFDAAPVDHARHNAQELDRTSSTPLWTQLLNDVHRRIENREFDTTFPGEMALREQYGVSRQTVRMALRSLRETGIVSNSRGQAPRVSNAVIEQPLGTLYSLFASVESAGMTQRSVVNALDTRTDPIAASKLELAADEPLVYLERIRLADGEPLAVDQAWLPASLASPLLTADFSHTALYVQLATKCGIEPRGGYEAIDAVVLEPSDADHLGCAAGSAGFAVDRLGCAAERPVEWRHSLIRADRFRVLAQFSPTRGYQVQMAPATTSIPPDQHNR